MVEMLQTSQLSCCACSDFSSAPSAAETRSCLPAAARACEVWRCSSTLLPGLCSLDWAGVSGLRMCALSMESGLLEQLTASASGAMLPAGTCTAMAPEAWGAWAGSAAGVTL